MNNKANLPQVSFWLSKQAFDLNYIMGTVYDLGYCWYLAYNTMFHVDNHFKVRTYLVPTQLERILRPITVPPGTKV